MEDLDFTAVLIDEISPVFDRILASLEEVAASFTASADTMSAAMDAVAASSDGAAAGSEAFVASLDAATVAITENTTALEENASATDADTAAKDGNAAAIKGAAGQLSLMGLAAAAAGGATFIMGTQSETAFNTLQAMAGVSADQMGAYTQAVDDAALKFGKNTTEMANGLYYVVSAGFNGADAITVLNNATMAAAASNTDMKVTSDALTSAMNAFGVDASQAGQYTDIMTEAVVQGKQQFSDFATAIGVGAVQGHAAHMSFAEVSAAEATMTQSGLSARRAVVDLDVAMRAIGFSNEAVAAAAKKAGLTFDLNAFSSMNLYDKLAYLKEITNGNTKEFEHLVGGSTGFTAAQIILSKNGETYNGILDKMKNSSGATAQAFAIHTETTKYAADKMAAAFSLVADNFQKMASPAVNGLLNSLSATFTHLASNGDAMKEVMVALAAVMAGGLVGALVSVALALNPITLLVAGLVIAVAELVTHWQAIVSWFTGTSAPALIVKGVLALIAAELLGMAVMAAPAFVTAFATIIVTTLAGIPAFWAAAVALIAVNLPLIGIGLAIMAVIGIIVLAITHWKQITSVIEAAAKACWQAITSVWNAIFGFFGSIFGAIGSAVSGFVAGFVSLIVGFVTSVSTHISSGFTAVSGVISGMLNGIRNIIQTAVTFYISAFKAMVDWVLGLFQWLYEHNKYIEAMVKDITGLITWLKTTISKLFTEISLIITTVLTMIKTDAINIWNGITTSISVAVHMIQATISAVWNGIAAFFGIIMSLILQALQADWNLFQTYILGPLNWVWTQIVNIGNSIMGFFSGLWSWLSSATATAWADFSGAIGGAAGTVLGAAGNIVSAITGVLGNLAGKALEWGQNMIKGFISGIGNMAGGVKDAVGNIMSNVGSFLGFHSPTEEGPGAEADQWGPNLIKMFAQGMTDTGGEVANAASGVAGLVQGRLGGGTGSIGVGGLSRGGSGAGTSGPVQVTINLNGGLGAGLQLLNPSDRQRLMSQIATEMGQMVNLQSAILSGYTGA